MGDLIPFPAARARPWIECPKCENVWFTACVTLERDPPCVTSIKNVLRCIECGTECPLE